jgi:hypothetical protein
MTELIELDSKDLQVLAVGGTLGSLQGLILSTLDRDEYRQPVAMAMGIPALGIGVLSSMKVIEMPRGATLFLLGYSVPLLSSILIKYLARNLPQPEPTSRRLMARA